MIRLSLRSLVYVNLILGSLVTIANGAALSLVLSGRAERLVDQSFEISAWVLVGALLAVLSVYAVVRSDKTVTILRLQAHLIAALALALAAWALMLVIGAVVPSVRAVWIVGYLSILAFYCALLGAHAYPEPRYSLYRHLLYWLLLPACVVIDILTYLKGMGSF